MSAPRRFIVIFTVALLLTWITLAIVAFGQLPDRIPMHFGPSGEADSYADKSVLSWFGLPLVGVITTLMLLGLAHATHRHPTIFNMPAKEQLLDLPTEAQQPFLEEIAIFMSLMATSVVLLFAAIQYDSWRVASASSKDCPPSPSVRWRSASAACCSRCRSGWSSSSAVSTMHMRD
jgi:uncharacterized membrane protein